MKIKIADNIFSYQFSEIKPFTGTASFVIEFEMDYLVTMNRKNEHFIEKMKDFFHQFDWLIVNDINIHCETYLSWGDKYFTDKIPDIENISVSFLKALIGYTGIVIDSSQFKECSCSYTEKTESYKKHFAMIIIRLKYSDLLKKDDLVFIRCYQKLCYPISMKKVGKFDKFLKKISLAKFPPKMNEVASFLPNDYIKYYSIFSINHNFPKKIIANYENIR